MEASFLWAWETVAANSQRYRFPKARSTKLQHLGLVVGYQDARQSRLRPDGAARIGSRSQPAPLAGKVLLAIVI